MKRGEIYFIKSNHREEGSEQRGDRPAVIVSNDKNNEHSETVEIVYMTTRPKNDLPTHVYTRSTHTPSTILCEQISSVSKNRVKEFVGTLTESEMQALDAALAISLGLDLGQSVRTCPSDCHGVVPIMREPTEEELKELLETMKQDNLQILPADPFWGPESAELIKAETERDIYRELYRELIEHMKGVTAR